jgi:CRP-like cAMP-binding protein
MAKNPDLNFAITKFIGLRIKKIQTRLENLIFKTSEQRITWLIKDFTTEIGRQIAGFPNQ